MSQLDAPTVRLIRKASPKSESYCCERVFESSGEFCVTANLTLLLNNFNENFNISPDEKCFYVSFIKL